MTTHVKKSVRNRQIDQKDRHSIQIMLNDREFSLIEEHVLAASKGVGGAVRNGQYAKNALLSHANLFATRQAVLDVVNNPASYHTYTVAQLIDYLRSSMKVS